MEQMGIHLGTYNGMVYHILTKGGKSRAGIQPGDIIKATNTAI